MSKWQMVKLGEVCDVVSGSTPKTSENRYWGGEYNWVTPAELNANTIIVTETVRKITEDAIKETSLKSFPKGTVLLSSRAPIGKVAIAGMEMYCNQGFKNFICSERLHNLYLFWFLKSKTDFLNSLGRGATFKEISKTIVKKIQIPLPPLEEQQKIAKNLDLASDIVKLYKNKLEELDKLIQSVFYDMFGDPVTNEMGWEVRKLNSLLDGKTSNGFFAKSADYTNDGNIEVLGVANIVNTMYSNTDNLPRANATEKDKEKFSVKYGDMLFCRSSLVATGIGKASIVPKNITNTILFECHVIRLQLDIEKCNPEFMQLVTTTNYFRNQVLKYAKTSTMTTIGQEGILNNNVIYPPLQLQQKFADIVTKIEEHKTEVNKVLKDAEMLYNSLMQQYFE